MQEYVINIIKRLFQMCGMEIRRKPLMGLDLFLYQTKLPKEILVPLREDSLFLDVGGYAGACSEGIYEAFNCNIICFEPSLSAFKFLEWKFFGIEKIKLEHCALLDKEGTASLYHKSNFDGNSLFKSLIGPIDDEGSCSHESVKTIDITHYLRSSRINKIDLMKLNCEGGEWCILKSLIDSGLIASVKQIIVQWHGDACSLDVRKDIWRNLSKSHDVFKYHPAWQLYRLKEEPF